MKNEILGDENKRDETQKNILWVADDSISARLARNRKLSESSIVYPEIYPSPYISLSSNDINDQIKLNFGYEFKGNKLVSIHDSSAYKFSNDYDSLSKYVCIYIQSLMKEAGLIEVWIPQSNPSINIFLSQDFYTNHNKLLIIIQGKGEVRAGQWSRKVCINENLENGSNLPYIFEAMSLGYSIIVLNPNYNKDINGNVIIDNANMIEHTLFVWENFIGKARAQYIGIVAHSCGGICVLNLIKNFFKEVTKRVKVVALLDSVHKTVEELNEKQKKFFEKTAKNWKRSQKKLGAKVIPLKNEGCICVSAGDPRHEYTSGSAFPEIFPYIEIMLQKAERLRA